MFEIEISPEWLQVQNQVAIHSSFLKPFFRHVWDGFAVDFAIFTTLHGFGEVTPQITKENQWFEGHFWGLGLWEAWESFGEAVESLWGALERAWEGFGEALGGFGKALGRLRRVFGGLWRELGKALGRFARLYIKNKR